MLTAAALCPAAPLLARELTGTDPVVPELRQACREAVDALVQSQPDVTVVLGPAGQTRSWNAATAKLDLVAYAPALGPRAALAEPLPVPLGLGGRLLDEAGYAGRRELQSIGADEQPDACAALGTQLAQTAPRVALLVMADGSARRNRRAPGYLDARSEPFDAEVSRAIRDGDLAALLTLDAELASELMATGRPAWQVLAGAADGSRPASAVRYDDDPFGVAYLVASLTFG
ncbi:MAG: hypothetical protein J2P28_12945 [Actinobacteria bacterium]|nr:hypothetical protein [Actinomycetota bacterium]MBO0836395.1 hypothetical protein [Actinomycetota bacterium]